MADLWGVLLGGGLTLAGGFLSQVLQASEKKKDRQAAADALMRAKAEEIFEAIADTRVTISERIYRRLSGKDPGETNSLPGYNKVYALCAAYYPSCVATLDEHRKIIIRSSRDFDRSDMTDDQYHRALAKLIASKYGDLCADVEKKLIREVQHYNRDLVKPELRVAPDALTRWSSKDDRKTQEGL